MREFFYKRNSTGANKCKWVSYDDKNSWYFYKTTIVSNKNKKIEGPRIGNGQWCTKQKAFWEIALQFFIKLYTKNVIKQDR